MVDLQREAKKLALFAEMPPLEEALLFLETVWKPLLSGITPNTLLGLVADESYIDKKTQLPTQSMQPEWVYATDFNLYIKDLLQWAYDQNTNPANIQAGVGSIFWQGASRSHSVLNRYHGRGRSDELIIAGSLWVDIDTETLGISLAEAFEKLLNPDLMPSPTFIIFSGGGLQAVHVLTEGIGVNGRESAALYKQYSIAFYSKLGAITDAKVHEPARQMRLPGFVNRKPKRNGARASILYYNAEAKYSWQDIQTFTTPYLKPKKAKSSTETKALPIYQYPVSGIFVAYMLEGAIPNPGKFHDIALAVAVSAAIAKMPIQLFKPLFLAEVTRWRSEDRLQEAERIVDWAYENADEFQNDARDAGKTLQITPELLSWAGLQKSSFAPTSADSSEKTEDSPPAPSLSVFGDNPLPLNQPIFNVVIDESDANPRLYVIEGQIPLPIDAIMDLTDLRDEQNAVIAQYLTDPAKRGHGELLLLKTAPGAGKTYAAIHAAIRYAELVIRNRAEIEDGTQKGQVIILTRFKKAGMAGLLWLREFGIKLEEFPDNFFYFFQARSTNPTSPGYCEQANIADGVARKNWNVHQTLCSTICPARMRCEQTGYLAQFAKAEQAEIVVGRPAHAMIEQLTANRKLVIFDEYPLDIVEAPLVVDKAECKLPELSGFAQDQYPDGIKTLNTLLAAIRSALATIPAIRSNSYPSESNLRLGGFWLYDQISTFITINKFPNFWESLKKMDKKQIAAIARGTAKADLPGLEKLPRFFIGILVELLLQELPLYQSGVKKWNSRIIPLGHSLHLYPMQPFSFTSTSKIIVTDATGSPDLYPRAFTDKQIRPRAVITYRKELTPKARTIQYTGTENSKISMFQNREKTEKLIISANPHSTYEDTVALALELRKINSALAQSMMLIHLLAVRHQKKLLIVSYKRVFDLAKEEIPQEPSASVDEIDKDPGDSEEQTTFSLLRRWISHCNILPVENTNWFGNLRGKNDYQDMEAVLILGTPRLQDVTSLIRAQVWHWNDPIPVSTDRQERELPFLGFSDEDGNGRGYRYWGYADPRVNSLYENAIVSELRQCIDRIRPNSLMTEGKKPKSIYLGTSFPCTPNVNQLAIWDTAHLGLIANLTLQWAWDELNLPDQKPIEKRILLDRIVSLTGVTDRTARTRLDEEYRLGVDPRDGIEWVRKLPETYGSSQKGATYANIPVIKNEGQTEAFVTESEKSTTPYFRDSVFSVKASRSRKGRDKDQLEKIEKWFAIDDSRVDLTIQEVIDKITQSDPNINLRLVRQVYEKIVSKKLSQVTWI